MQITNCTTPELAAQFDRDMAEREAIHDAHYWGGEPQEQEEDPSAAGRKVLEDSFRAEFNL